MQREYGSKKGKSVFYASINKGTVTGAEGYSRGGLTGYAEGGIVEHHDDPDLPALQDDARLERVSPTPRGYPPEYIATIERLLQNQRKMQGLDQHVPSIDQPTARPYDDGGEVSDPNFFYRPDREREQPAPRYRAQPFPMRSLRRFRRGGQYHGDGIDEVWDGSQAGHRWAGGVKHLDDGGGGDGSGGGGGGGSGGGGGGEGGGRGG